MIKLVCFADSRMTKSQELCVSSSLKYGVEKVYDFRPEDIDLEFSVFNKDILNQDRGAGYWLWKPYVVYRAMMNCELDDVLIYSDAGVEWISDVMEIVNRMDEDIFFFSNGHQHVHWCKGDVLGAILGEDGELDQYFCSNDNQQVQASVIFFKVNQKTKDFVKEWLLWSQMPGFIDDSPSKLPNHPEFAEHRHDQSILTCLQIKYGYKLHWWADKLWYESQRYRWPEDTYPPMFRHHRKRNGDW